MHKMFDLASSQHRRIINLRNRAELGVLSDNTRSCPDPSCLKNNNHPRPNNRQHNNNNCRLNKKIYSSSNNNNNNRNNICL